MDLTFKSVLEDAQKKYNGKKATYGDSWKRMTLMELRKRLREEYIEWAKTLTVVDSQALERGELLDIINVACMLAERIEFYLKTKNLRRGDWHE